MIPAIKYVLFYISTFLSTNTTTVSQEAKLRVDFNSHEVVIEYIDIKAPEAEVEQANKDLHEDYSLNAFELDTVIFEETNGRLNAKVSFHFDDKVAALNYLGFTKMDGVIRLPIFTNEKLKKSNGKLKKDNTVPFPWVEWGESVEMIELHLGRSKKGKERVTNYMRLTSPID